MARKFLVSLSSLPLKICLNPLISSLLVVALILAVSLTGNNGIWPENLAPNANSDEFSPTCDVFSGSWVFDNVSYPLYSESQCKFMSDELACEKFGRKDVRYQKWRWQPHDCNLPRFNGTALLEILRGKRLVFVGDSLNRGQWVSMVCLLDSSTPDATKSMHTNGSLRTFTIMDYNATVEFYWEPLLVESNSDDPVNHRVADRIVRVESITGHARHWTGADFLVFNSYLWWRRQQMKTLWGSFEGTDNITKVIETLRVYKMALRTWSDWLEAHIDPFTTQLFFVSMSPTHFWADEWGAAGNGNCYGETEPIEREGHWGRGSDARLMRAVEVAIEALRERGLNVQMLNITQLSEYRKDGHPSIHRKQWEPLTEQQAANPSSYADCQHWCVPGVPDIWNEILYAHIVSKPAL